jgi:hypothetical protein
MFKILASFNSPIGYLGIPRQTMYVAKVNTIFGVEVPIAGSNLRGYIMALSGYNGMILAPFIPYRYCGCNAAPTIAYDAKDNEVFFAQDSTVTVVSTMTDKLLANISLPAHILRIHGGSNGVSLSYDSLSDTLYAAHDFAVFAINPRTDKQIARISFYPALDTSRAKNEKGYSFVNQITFDKDNGNVLALVAAYNLSSSKSYDELAVVSGSSNRVIKTITAPSGQSFFGSSMVFDSSKNLIYISDLQNDIDVMSGSTYKVLAVLPYKPTANGFGADNLLDQYSHGVSYGNFVLTFTDNTTNEAIYQDYVGQIRGTTENLHEVNITSSLGPASMAIPNSQVGITFLSGDYGLGVLNATSGKYLASIYFFRRGFLSEPYAIGYEPASLYGYPNIEYVMTLNPNTLGTTFFEVSVGT